MRLWILLVPALLWGAEPSNDFQFAIVGDRTGGANGAIYTRIWRQIGARKPAFSINVGDTIEGLNDATAEREWSEARIAWSQYKFPFYFTPGNHDIWSARSLEIYKRETGRPNYYSFNYQDAHFTVLDNSRTLDLDETQLRFLEDDLQKNRERNPKFIFFHVPYWVAFLKLGSGGFPLHQLARKYGVQYIMSGHAHQFMRMTRDGIAYMAVGSSGAALKGSGFREGHFYHYVWGLVKGSKVELTVHELEGRSFRAEEWGQ